MTTYRPLPEPWHEEIPGKCSCDLAYAERGMVDDRCYWHGLIQAIEDLRDIGWKVEPGDEV